MESERDRRLSEAADRLRGRFGEGALLPARVVPGEKERRERGKG